MRALSIRQPWAWLIVQGHKAIENREWRTSWRGELLIHASKTLTRKYHAEMEQAMASVFGIQLPPFEAMQLGGIVGVARLHDCIDADHPAADSPWFMGPYGLVLSEARALPFHPCKGALSFFDVPAIDVGLQPGVPPK